MLSLAWRVAGICLVCSASSVADEIKFNRDVRPILSNHCFTCHGPDSATREGGFRLDKRESATGTGDSGLPVIVPGNAEAGELLRRVTSHDPDERMPPAGGPSELSADQIKILSDWIHQGAAYEAHWAFLPPEDVRVPPAQETDWPRNDIDRFVLRRLKAEGLRPSPEADRETLIRRVAFDLTGLPPTVQAIDAYLADKSPDAFERIVEQYLSSPAYAEHMARHWLDLARYADSNGYQYDTERQQWVWRDWVIDAYHRNMPFDQFTVEQLAGDLLPNATAQQRLATGFNRNHGITIEGGVIDEEYRTEYVMDRLTTTTATWLGLTVGCARCHDHKFDPLSQQEFYQLYAFFNQVPERGLNGFAPQEQIPSPLAADRFAEIDQKIKDARRRLEAGGDFDGEFQDWLRDVRTSSGWIVLTPVEAHSTGGSDLKLQTDGSLLAGGANPQKDIYEIVARTDQTAITAIRLEALTDPSLPGGGPGRHSNSNFVLSEFEVTAVSQADPNRTRTLRFRSARADYSQANYEIGRAIDGVVTNNNGWAVDGPTRKKPAAAVFVSEEPFGFPGGTELRFRLRHEANFATHGIGRPRLSVSLDPPERLSFQGIPPEIHAAARRSAGDRSSEEQRRLRAYFLEHHHPLDRVRKQIVEWERERKEAYPATMVMRDQEALRPTHVLNRGLYNAPGEAVSAGVPEIFPAMSDKWPKNRLGLARWLVDPQHPLTARVAVNRYWQRMFGTGLVKTSEDFGVQGELPSHPDLLDWLATEFVRSGWDVKAMQRRIVLSATYRQSSKAGAEAYRRDPENRLLARGPRLRLDGEEVRDAALAASGLLLDRLGGPSVYPYQPEGLWLELNNRPGYSKAYPHSTDPEQLYRRSIYTFWKRTVPSPMLKTLDAPEREFCTIRRSRTNTPLQALLLLNGPQFVEAAERLGDRMNQQEGTLRDQLSWGFRAATSRRPSMAEVALLQEAFEEAYAGAQAKPGAPSDAPTRKAFMRVARLILNLDEAISKG